jgi:hypothetical protein
MSTPIILPDFEAAQLEQLEERIQCGLKSFVEVGEALTAIRDRRLYRATHGTFEEYCRDKWGWSKQHAYRLMECGPIAKSNPQVTSINQARELARVEPERRQEVVERAVEATGGKITAVALKEAVRTIDIAPASSTPASDTYTKWRDRNYRKRKKDPKDPQPDRTREELIEHFIYCFEGEGANFTAADLKKIPSLLAVAWNEAVAAERMYQSEVAEAKRKATP